MTSVKLFTKVFLIVIIGFFIGFTTPLLANDNSESYEEIYSDLETFANAITIIEGHYVDEVSPRDLIYGALKGMLASLDPYSQFLDPEAHEEIKVETEGQFGGVGVEISIRDSILTVIAPIDDSPAQKAGVLAGDKIVKIDGENSRDFTLSESVKKLRGKPGTKVELSVLREGESRLLEFVIKRAIVKVKSVKRSTSIDGIGYIRISEFQENTPRDFKKTLTRLEKQKIKGLVIDLRNNPGGLLPEAIQVAENFVPRDKLIVSIKGKTLDQNIDFISRGVKEVKSYPIVILVNHGSASASEIFAAGLQGHGLGIVLGTNTFGKGSVQTVIPMQDGSAIRLTTSKYFTPKGDAIHGIGIEPNVVVEIDPAIAKSNEEEIEALRKNTGDDALSEDEIWIRILKDYDLQAQRAFDLIRGIQAYQEYDDENKELN